MMKRILVVLIVVAFPTCLSAAGWLGFAHGRRHHSKQVNETVITPASVATLHQNFDFFAPNAFFVASPSVYKNVVYIGGGFDGIFYAIHGKGPNKGTLLWQYPPATATVPDACGITSQPLKLPQSFANPGIASSAAIVNSVPGHTAAVIFGAPDPTSNNGDGRVWALDATTGACIWKSPVIAPQPGNSKIGYSSPAIAHGRAFIGVAARVPDSTLTQGKLFSINLTDGSLDPAFSFTSSGLPSGGGIWGSPAIAPNGNVIVVTGNSCHHFVPPPVACPGPLPVPDYTNSMLELDWTNGTVLWQVQPVHVDWDNDPDWAVPPIVAKLSCGTLALSVQKDGYLHAAEIKGVVSSNPACSYPGHTLECPLWSFPSVATLPFTEDGHGDTPFIRPGALDGTSLYITSGGYNLTEMPPTNVSGNLPSGRIRFDRLYSFDVCATAGDRIRWVFTSPNGDLGGVSTTNGVIFVGTRTGTSHLYALGDPSVAGPGPQVCSYPNLPVAMCTSANFTLVDSPLILKDISSLQGEVRGIPAISNGQVYVATSYGHLYGFIP